MTSGTGSLRRVAGISIQGAARKLLDSDVAADVVTLNEDGSPHVTAAWVGVEGDEIVLATIPDQRKLRNLRRDPRIALSIPTTRVNNWGLLECLVVYGTARVTEGGAPRCSNGSPTHTSGLTLCFHLCQTRRPGLSRGSRRSGSAASGLGTRHSVDGRNALAQVRALGHGGRRLSGLNPARIEGTKLGIVTARSGSHNVSRRCRGPAPIPRQAVLRRLR